MITMIGVGVQGRDPYTSIKATVDTDLFHAFTAVTNIVFAYCAHVAFFGLLAEMREPRDFPKALYMLQTFEIIFYTVAAVVIYYYAGQSVESPALGSAGPVLKKVAYGIAIPTVSISYCCLLDCVRAPSDESRLSVPVLSTATLVSSTSTFASSVEQTVCIAGISSRMAPGLRSV
jgi:hypothetical protein